MRKLACLLALLVLSSSASAESTIRIALTLGDLAGSEQLCGFAIDSEALEIYIANTIPGDDLDFASTMRDAAKLMPDKFADMSRTMQVAHCTQMKRIAKSLGFSK